MYVLVEDVCKAWSLTGLVRAVEEQFLESLKVWKSPWHRDLGEVLAYYLNSNQSPLLDSIQIYLHAKFFKWFNGIQWGWSLTNTTNDDIHREAAIQQSTTVFYDKGSLLVNLTDKQCTMIPDVRSASRTVGAIQICQCKEARYNIKIKTILGFPGHCGLSSVSIKPKFTVNIHSCISYQWVLSNH